jgi:N-acetylmuramoyl-L-alanine amidase
MFAAAALGHTAACSAERRRARALVLATAINLTGALTGALPAWSQMPLPAPVPPAGAPRFAAPQFNAPPAAAASPSRLMGLLPPGRLPLTVEELLGKPSPREQPPAAESHPLPGGSLMLPPPPAVEAAEEPAIATGFHLTGNDRQTRLTIDLSRRIDMRAFTLADPYRVVIEIPQVDFQLPANTGDQGRGIIKAFRYGLVMSGGSRIVIDLTGPVRVTKALVLEPADGRPAQMVLDVMAVDRETFLRAAAIDNHLPRARPPARAGRDETTGDSRPVVVIDAGHGGIDPGTRAPTGEIEKDLTLEFAIALRGKLEAAGKYRVMMTRFDDRFIELSERVQIARAQRAQLLISIHCDALARGDGEAQGATVYTLSDQASDAEAQRLADAENRADAIGGVDLADAPNEIADILIDLAQRETKSFTANFARNVVKEMSTTARMHKHPQKSAGFRVLKAPDVPSVLIELGYVSNPRDLKQLVSESWRARTADAVAHAVQTYFTTRLAGGSAAPRTQ